MLKDNPGPSIRYSEMTKDLVWPRSLERNVGEVGPSRRFTGQYHKQVSGAGSQVVRMLSGPHNMAFTSCLSDSTNSRWRLT